jgi:hypothetical protein
MFGGDPRLMLTNHTAEMHLRALREKTDVLSAKVDAILTCLREEIDKKARRRERVEFRLLLVCALVPWLCLIATAVMVDS